MNKTIYIPSELETFYIPVNSIDSVIQSQSFEGGWVCPDCKHHGGNLRCNKNCFISFTGCWTKNCMFFNEK